MWHFDYPFVLWLLPLALIRYRWARPYQQTAMAVLVPFFSRLSQSVSRGATVRAPGAGGGFQLAVHLCIWGLMIVAVAKPIGYREPIVVDRMGRDIMLLIDISESMETRDIVADNGQRLSRWQSVADVVKQFVAGRKDDQIGLVVFGSDAYAQASFTSDHATLIRLLDQLAPGLAGPNTAMGDALGVGLKMIEGKGESYSPTFVLLTDGSDNASSMPPDRAATLVGEQGVAVHAVGIGDPSEIDVETLTAISESTGGSYFFAGSGQPLSEVFALIDQQTPRLHEVVTRVPTRELYWVPVAVAGGLVLTLFLGTYIRHRVREHSSSGSAEPQG